MTIGISSRLTKAILDDQFGEAAIALDRAMRTIQELRHFCLITPDAFFTNLGYVASEISIVKAAMSDGDQVRQAYQGLITLPLADYRQNLQQLGGDLVT